MGMQLNLGKYKAESNEPRWLFSDVERSPMHIQFTDFKETTTGQGARLDIKILNVDTGEQWRISEWSCDFKAVLKWGADVSTWLNRHAILQTDTKRRKFIILPDEEQLKVTTEDINVG